MIFRKSVTECQKSVEQETNYLATYWDLMGSALLEISDYLQNHQEILCTKYPFCYHDKSSACFVLGLLCLLFVFIRFLCRLPFWQRHIVFTVSSKNWHVLKRVFYGFQGLIYFIELKSINPKNSVCVSLSLSLYISVPGQG